MRLSRRSLLSIAAAMPLVAAGKALAAANRPFTVTGYGGGYQHFMEEQLVNTFYYNTRVLPQMHPGRASSWVAALRNSRRGDPPFDVLIASQNWTSQAIEQGLLQPLQSNRIPNLANVLPLARMRSDMAVTCAVAPVGIAYRADLVPAPTSWQDLWEVPEYQGRIGLYPAENSFGMMFLMMAARLFHGTDQALDDALETVKKLRPYTVMPSSGNIYKALQDGRIAIAPLDFPAAGALRDLGNPVKIVAPREGVFMYAHRLSVPAGTPYVDEAHAWINHVLSADVQKAFLTGLYWSPVDPDIIVPESYREVVPIAGRRMNELVTFDWEAANRQRAAIVTRWRQEM